MRQTTTMFNKKKSTIRYFVLALAGLLANHAQAALSGTYTLNPSGAATATNYKNMVSFAQDLYAGTRTDGGPANGTGVSGPVILRLATGITLTEQVEFRAVSGASSVNTITIKGSLSTLQFTATVTTSKQTIWMNGAQYYTIDSLRVLSNGTSLAWGIRFSNNANNNIITNSSILIPNISTGVTSSTTSTSTQAAICFNASSSVLDYTPRSATSCARNGVNNIISKCTIGGNGGNAGPTYCIFDSQNDTSGNNTYTGNKIQHFYLEGIAFNTGDGITITDNEFTRLGNTSATTTLKAINLFDNVRAFRTPVTITNNTIHDFPAGGITMYGIFWNNNNTYFTNYNGGTQASVISNNKIYNNTPSTFYGIYCNYIKNSGGTTVSNNTVYKNRSTATFYGIYAQASDKVVINANTVNSNRGATLYGLYMITSPTNSKLTNNLVFKNIATGNEYGMYITGSGTGWIGNNYSNNTIAFDSTGWTSGNTYGIYLSAGSATVPRTNNSVFNNNIYIAHKGSSTALKYGFYNFWGYTGYTEEHNNIYFDAANVSPAITYYGSDFAGPLINLATLSAWTAFGYSNKDHDVDPYFNRTKHNDYSFVNSVLNNVGSNAGINLDIEGNSRTVSTPDVGAFEVIFKLAAVSTNITLANACSGYTDSVKLTVQNNSPGRMFNIPIGIMVNGSLYTTKVATDTIASGASKTLTFQQTLSLHKAGNAIVKFFIPKDEDNTNDTITKVINVIAAPSGSVMTKQGSSAGMVNWSGKGYDVLAFDEVMTFDMTAPSKYTDADYPTKWSFTTWAKGPKGSTLPVTAWTGTHPSATVLKFVPPASYIDSTVTLYVQVKDWVTGCDTVYTRLLFIAPKGKPKYKVIPSFICEGTPVTFDNTSTVSSGELSYLWDFGDGTDMSDDISPVHVFSSFGTFNVKMRTITVPYGYVRDSIFKITITEIPKVNFTHVNACEGLPVKFTNTTTTGSVGTVTYEWNFGDGSPLSNINSPSKLYTVPGGYKVTLKATDNGCSASVTKNVYEFVKPKAAFTYSAPNGCDNEEFSFSDASTIAMGQYWVSWDFNENKGFATDLNPKYDFSTPGTKNVKLIARSEFGCLDSVVKQVSVKAAPESDFSHSPACNVDPTQFTNETDVPSGTLASYQWDFGDGSATSNLTSPLHAWAIPGTRQVTLSTVLDNGCRDKVTKELVVGIQPKVDFTAADQCSGAFVEFNNLTTWSNNDISFMWEFGEGGSSTEAAPSYKYVSSITKTYNVKLKGMIEGGCSDSVVKTVTIHALPTSCDFDIVYDGTQGHRNYRFVPKGNAANIDFTWETGDGGTRYSTGTNATYGYKKDGKYTVTMTSRNAAGCECSQAKVLDINWSGITSQNISAAAVSVYPNPNTGIFTVALDGAEGSTTVKVYNLLGELVKVQTSDNTSLSMDMSGFASGMYMLKIYNGNASASVKVNINH